MDLGIPQHRKRWYLMGIRADCLRTRPADVDWWPSPLPYSIPLERLVKPLPAADWQALPESEPGRGNVLSAYKSCKEKGTNPFMVPVVVDMDASPRFRSFRVGSCPCITKTRAGSFAYWCSTKGGRLSLSELMMLQGFQPAAVAWEEAGLTASQMAQCLGNAQSWNVVVAVLPRLLYLAKLIDSKDFGALVA